MRFVFVLMLLTTPAIAADCPAEQPHKVQIDTGRMYCTLLACIGELKCDERNKCHRLPAKECNTCTPVVYEACLSDEELKRARR